MTLKQFLTKQPLLQRFYRDKSGVVALEMTLLIIPFILLFLLIAELCSILYVSVSIDLAMAEAMRYTSSSATTTPTSTITDYKATFLNKIEERIKYLPLMVYKPENVTFTVNYCKSLTELADNNCKATKAELPEVNDEGETIIGTGTPVAIYHISYKYPPLFFPIPDVILKSGMNRKGIYVMENTRIRTL